MSDNTIGTRVRTQREAKGYTRKELAKKTSYSESAIKLLESGRRRNPGVDFLHRIGEALDVPIQYFLTDEQDTYIARCNQWDSRYENLSEEDKAKLLAVELEYCQHEDPYDKMMGITRIILPTGSGDRIQG